MKQTPRAREFTECGAPVDLEQPEYRASSSQTPLIVVQNPNPNQARYPDCPAW